MLLLLRRRRDEAIRAGLGSGWSLPRIASAVQAVTAAAVQDGRALSRIAGLSRLEAEAASVGFELARLSASSAERVRDYLRARTVADSYASRWLRKAEGDNVRRAAHAASENTAGSLRRIGITESSEAFTAERTDQARRAHSSLELLKVWDAQLDKRTCPVCSRADGTIVGIRERFPDGEPGAVHAHCRCGWTLLTGRTDRGTLTITPAALRPVAAPKLVPPPLPSRAPVLVAKPDPLLAPLPAKASAAAPVTAGIAESELKFLRSGYRAPLKIYDDVLSADVDAIATGRLSPPGSRNPLPPITINVYPDEFHLVDGRHRLEAAQKAGATRIRANIRVYGPRGGLKWEGEREIPIPRPDPTNKHGRS